MLKKMLIISVFTVLFSSLYSSENLADSAGGQESPSGQASISKGKELFDKYCISCHGANGRGKTPLGKTISNMPDLANPSTNEKSDQELFKVVTNGKAPMPSFKRLSEEDRWDLIHYVRTFASQNEK